MGSRLPRLPQQINPAYQMSYLEITDIKKYLPAKVAVFFFHKGNVKAVDGVGLSIEEGKILGLVGESGAVSPHYLDSSCS